MTLIEPIGTLPPSTEAAGFVPRDAEDAIARHLLRPLLFADRETVLLAGFDGYARLVGLECAEGDASGRCVIAPTCWNRLLAQRVETVLMAHNHPSGIARPSDADIRCTREAHALLRLIGIDLIDHLIFVESGHFSFRHARLV
ncbi:JAB domain-containing protein [Sphingopyxis sp.]|uniref:JAB domain-containing protein n=1 Tax=Sphingopyxis sp. TaxID=1908224 RepID=UPI003BAC9C80